MNKREYRHLDRAGLDVLLDLANNEGWNPGFGDAAAFLAADPSGFHGLHVEGRFTVGMSLVQLNTSDGFLGLYIAKPDQRGHGLGLDLWTRMIDHAESRGVTRIGLDGVVKQQANYKKSGFDLLHRNLRFTGSATALPKATMDGQTVDYHPGLLDASVTLDHRIGGVKRERFLRAWLTPSDGRRTFVCYRDGELSGLATVRPCHSGWKIGPVLADTPEVAHSLLARISEHVKEFSTEAAALAVTIDVPEPNATAVALMRNAGFEQAFETARMYRGGTPGIETDRLWGIATLELG